MFRKPRCFLVLVLLCGVGKAGVSLADGPLSLAACRRAQWNWFLQ